MKKKLALLLCATLLLSLMLPLVSASAVLGPQWVWSEDGNPVKLRESPSQDSRVLTKIPYGTKLTKCSYYSSTWMKVSYGQYSGYMMTHFIWSKEPPYHPVYPTAKPTAKPTTKPTPTTGMFSKMQKVDYYVVVNPSNNAAFGNMRWAPSENQPIINIYYPGYQLKVLYTDGTWYQVLDEANGICGFMRNYLLQPVLAVGTQAQ